MNDDLTGANDSPNLLGALAKILVLITIAIVAFVTISALGRLLGLIK